MSAVDDGLSALRTRPEAVLEPHAWRSRWVNQVASSAREAWRRFCSDRLLHSAILWGTAAWAVLQLSFLLWVHCFLEGSSHRAFLTDAKFGVPVREAAAGMQVVQHNGYDGQMYYWMSNDVFARFDAYKHMDACMYRYQRIGVPMIAGGLATLLGFELTPPLLYHSLQFGITAAGFAALVYWLKLKQLHPAYALGWLISAGTLQSLFMGILDAPADAFFIFAFFGVLTRRLWLYVPFASILLLTREGYVVYAFAVFLATIMGRLAWQDSSGTWRPLARLNWQDAAGYWKRVVWTAVPGIVLVAWSVYLAVHFQERLLAHHNNARSTALPFAAMLQFIGVFWRRGDWFELRLAAVSAFTLVLIITMLVRNWRKLPLALVCAIPVVLLTASFGTMVWETYNGHMKASGTIIILGLLLLPLDKSMLLRFMLALQAIAGIHLEFELRAMTAGVISPYFLHELTGYPPNSPDAPDNPVLTDLRSSVEWVGAESICTRDYQGVWSPVHRELKPIQVAITNHSDVTWQPGRGKHPIWLGYTIYNGSGNRQLCQHSVILDKPIAPGETHEVTTYLELRGPFRKYVVEFSVWQDGPGWFVRADPSFGRRYEFTVD